MARSLAATRSMRPRPAADALVDEARDQLASGGPWKRIRATTTRATARVASVMQMITRARRTRSAAAALVRATGASGRDVLAGSGSMVASLPAVARGSVLAGGGRPAGARGAAFSPCCHVVTRHQHGPGKSATARHATLWQISVGFLQGLSEDIPRAPVAKSRRPAPLGHRGSEVET